MRGKSRRQQLLEQQRLRTIVGAQSPLLHDDLDLFGELFRRQRQVRHAVGFQLERERQLRFLQLLVIAGRVLGSERIVATARRRDAFRKFAGGNGLRALEHHVLEHVRDTRFAVHFVDTAGAIPDHRHDGGGAVIFLNDDAQAVRELVLAGFGLRGGGARDEHGHRYCDAYASRESWKHEEAENIRSCIARPGLSG